MKYLQRNIRIFVKTQDLLNIPTFDFMMLNRNLFILAHEVFPIHVVTLLYLSEMKTQLKAGNRAVIVVADTAREHNCY